MISWSINYYMVMTGCRNLMGKQKSFIMVRVKSSKYQIKGVGRRTAPVDIAKNRLGLDYLPTRALTKSCGLKGLPKLQENLYH